MQTHLPSNPAMLMRTLVPEQHIGMMNIYIHVGLVLWSGQKDELDDKHIHKHGLRPSYSLERNAACKQWMKEASTKWGRLWTAAGKRVTSGAEKPERWRRRS